MGVEDQKITREESVIFNMEGLEGQDFIVRVPDSNTRGRTPQQKSRRISISVNKVAIPVSQIAHNPTISIVAYCLASISMTVTNKYCVSGPEWNMNFFLLAFQSAICILTIYVCKSSGMISSLSPFSYTKARKWFPVSLLLVAMTYTSAKALQYLSVPIYTIFKNLTIIVIAYGEMLLFKSFVTRTALFSFGLMVLSSIVAAWADISHAARITYDRGLMPGLVEEGGGKGRLEMPNPGYVWMGLNVLCSASYVLGMRRVIKNMGFRDWDTMYYNNVLTLPILILCTFFLESWNGANLALNFPASSRSAQFIAMIYSGLATIFISYASAWCIRITSSTTYSMVGALNKLPIAVSGLLVFEKEITKGGFLAILMGFGSGVVYAFAKKRESGAARRLGKERDIERLEKGDGFERATLLPSRRPSLKLGKVHE